MTSQSSNSMHRFRRLAEAAPVLALAALLTMPLLLRREVDDAKLVLARNAVVQQAVNAVPYRLGDWVGEDVEVPASAVEILRPNAVLSRRFNRLGGGTSVHLLVIHCSDARDMQGHYPPICYPANGWIRTDETGVGDTCSLRIGGESVELRIYNFRQLDAMGGERRLRVYNYFLLPGARTTVDLSIVNRLVERSVFSVRGVAQVQLVLNGEEDLEEGEHAVEELLNEAMSHLTALSQGEMKP